MAAPIIAYVSLRLTALLVRQIDHSNNTIKKWARVAAYCAITAVFAAVYVSSRDGYNAEGWFSLVGFCLICLGVCMLLDRRVAPRVVAGPTEAELEIQRELDRELGIYDPDVRTRLPGEPLFDKPPVHYNRNGVAYVNPEDILMSRAGQEEIRKAAAMWETWNKGYSKGVRRRR